MVAPTAEGWAPDRAANLEAGWVDLVMGSGAERAMAAVVAVAAGGEKAANYRRCR